MEFAKELEGAVFFVDLLGMGALTQNDLKLDDDDFSVWLEQYQVKYNHQFLATALLSEFRNILTSLSKEFSNVQIAQLSDCAFIWSENVTDVVLFSNNLMTKALEKGLLCRGGLSYGEIIETAKNENHKLGKFIVGKAVSRAVKLESISKGARILIDEDFPSNFCKNDSNFYTKIQNLFAPFTNVLDYSIYDEFKWYLIPNLKKDTKSLSLLDNIEKVSFTKERLKLAANVRFSPKFNWNIVSKHGIIQVKATIDFLTSYDEDVLKIWHDFRWQAHEIEIIHTEDKPKRSEAKLEKIKKEISENEHYIFVEDKQKKNKLIRKFKDIEA